MKMGQKNLLERGYLQEKENFNLHAGKKEIIFEMLAIKDLEETIACMVDVFPRGEPMTKAMEITSDEFYPFAEIYCKKAIKEGLSLVARNKETGNVIGFLISEDLASLPPNSIKTINEKFLPIIKLLDELDENYKQSFELNGQNILRLFMVGVNEHYEGLNLATTLIEKSLKLAMLKNYSYAIGEATSSVTQHILRDKLGFDEKFAIDYKSYTYNGKHVFNNMKNTSCCVLLEKRLF